MTRREKRKTLDQQKNMTIITLARKEQVQSRCQEMHAAREARTPGTAHQITHATWVRKFYLNHEFTTDGTALTHPNVSMAGIA